MSRHCCSLLVLLSLAVSVLRGTELNTGHEIIEAYFKTRIVDSELAYVRMAIYPPAGEAAKAKRFRILGMVRKNDAGDYASMLRLVRPQSLEGVTFLSLEEGESFRKFIYLPAVDEVTELRGSALGGQFLGSDFSYEELLREVPRRSKFKRLEDTVIHGAKCYAVKAMPMDPEDSQYHHRIVFIEKDRLLLHKVDFFEAPGDLIKSLEAFGHGSEHIEGKSMRPRYAVMTNHELGSVSVINTVEARQQVELDPAYFTTERVKTLTPDEVRSLIYDNGFEIDAAEDAD